MKTKTKVLGLALFALLFSAIMQVNAACLVDGKYYPYGFNDGGSKVGTFICKHDNHIYGGDSLCYLRANGHDIYYSHPGHVGAFYLGGGISVTSRTSGAVTLTKGMWLCKADGTWERAQPGKCYIDLRPYNAGVNTIDGEKWLCALNTAEDWGEWRIWNTYLQNKCTFNSGGYKFTYKARETPYNFYGGKYICRMDGKWFRVSRSSESHTSSVFDCYNGFSCFWGQRDGIRALYAKNKNTGVTWYYNNGWVRA